jgi:predicted TIM-barrel fold metal-dependent hydrolase
VPASAVDLAGLAAVDGHCHPLFADPWTVSPRTFLDIFSEGRPGAMAAHLPQTGYYRRALRALARRVGAALTVEDVLARRQALGPAAAVRAVADGGVRALLVDTGYPPDAMPLAEMRRLVPCPLHEVFRIETCAQALLPRALDVDRFFEAFRAELHTAAGRCVAFKTIVAYRSGLAIRTWTPDEVAASYRQVVERVRAGGTPRLTEKPLLDTLVGEALAVARATGRPIQVHSGFGDPDIDLLQANPLLLRRVLEDGRWAGVPIVLLHQSYPYVREAAYLAAIWPQVHVDLSLAPAFLGPGCIPSLVEMLSLAPWSKLLYGSDVGGLPELFGLVADWTRDWLGEALGWLVERSELGADEARAAGRAILAENAMTLYGLPRRGAQSATG